MEQAANHEAATTSLIALIIMFVFSTFTLSIRERQKDKEEDGQDEANGEHPFVEVGAVQKRAVEAVKHKHEST